MSYLPTDTCRFGRLIINLFCCKYALFKTVIATAHEYILCWFELYIHHPKSTDCFQRPSSSKKTLLFLWTLNKQLFSLLPNVWRMMWSLSKIPLHCFASACAITYWISGGFPWHSGTCWIVCECSGSQPEGQTTLKVSQDHLTTEEL